MPRMMTARGTRLGRSSASTIGSSASERNRLIAASRMTSRTRHARYRAIAHAIVTKRIRTTPRSDGAAKRTVGTACDAIAVRSSGLLGCAATTGRPFSQPRGHGLYQHHSREGSHDRYADGREHAEARAVSCVAEYRAAVGEDQDVGQQDRGDESIEHLGVDHEFNGVPG